MNRRRTYVRPTTSRRARHTLALVVASTLALAGCGAIPVDGPVSVGDVDLVESNPLYLQVYGPVTDATPEQVVRGFLTAQAAGPSDNYATARKFLSEEASEVWNPNDQVTVFSGDLTLTTLPEEENPDEDALVDSETTPDPTEKGKTATETAATQGATSLADSPPKPSKSAKPSNGGKADVTDPTPEGPEAEQVPTPVDASLLTNISLGTHLDVRGTINGRGQFTEAIGDASQDVMFALARDTADQWRITKTSDGALIQEANFMASYRSTNLYFLSPDAQFLVPDVRWFPQSHIATHATQALLAGPAPWLQDAVLTGIPVGTRLAIDAVSVDGSGVAHVDLSAGTLDAPDEQRALLTAQIEATLSRLPGVGSVEILVAGNPLSVTKPADPTRDPVPRNLPVGIRGDTVMQLSGRTVSPKPGIASVADQDVTALAFGEEDGPTVIRSGTDEIRTVPSEGEGPTTILTGPELLAPSVDRFGWVWSGTQDSDGMLLTARLGEAENRLEVDWLDGMDVLAVRVSREGTRVAVISRTAGRVQIDVAAIVRDDVNKPQQLSQPVPVGASITFAKDLAWVDETTMAILGQTSDVTPLTVHTVPVGGHSEPLTVIDGANALAAGRGQRTLYVGTKSGELWSRSSTGTNWSLAVDDIRFFTYSG